MKTFSTAQAKELASMAKALGEANKMEWDCLLTCKRIRLLEVCCSPASGLTETMQRKAGPDSAFRMSSWNGFDLSTPQGVAAARAKRAELRPTDLWVSTPCGPWSSLQQFNQKTPEQCEALQQKRMKSLKIIKGALLLVKDQMEDGGDFHWEWPKDCAAYKLPTVVQSMDELGALEAILFGCAVGMKDKDGKPIAKPWRIKTSSARMAKRLSIGCQGNHKHAPCMGSQTAAASAYYPQPMCDKVVSAILEKDSEEEVARQITEAAFIVETAFAGEENEGTGAKKTTEKEEPLNKEERARMC